MIFISSLILFFLFNMVNAAELTKTDGEGITPALKLESLKGKTLDLADYKGKVVLVQFWATYCTPCRVEMPSMNKLIKKLKEENVKFEILAVNMGETKAEIQKFVDQVKPEFTILLGQGDNMQAWNVFAAPSNFLIGPKGKIRYTLYGGVEWDSEEIIKAIKGLSDEIETIQNSDSKKEPDEEKSDKTKEQPKETKQDKKSD